MKEHSDLKAWCHWKRKEKDLSEDDTLFVKAIEDVISQAGMASLWREKSESFREAHLLARNDVDRLQKQLAKIKDGVPDTNALEVKRLRRTLEDIATGFGGVEGEAYEDAVRKYASDALDESEKESPRD